MQKKKQKVLGEGFLKSLDLVVSARDLEFHGIVNNRVKAIDGVLHGGLMQSPKRCAKHVGHRQLSFRKKQILDFLLLWLNLAK